MSEHSLIANKLVTHDQFHVLELQRDMLLRRGVRRSFEELAIENRFVKPSQISEGSHSLSRELIDMRIAQAYQVRPITIRDNVMEIRCARILNEREESELRRIVMNTNTTLTDVEFLPGDIADIIAWLRHRQSINNTDLIDKVELLNSDPNNPVLLQDVVDGLYNIAIMRGASDIHLKRNQRADGQSFVELRIDGQMKTLFLLSYEAMSAIFARIKSQAQLDISNAYVPQDGRSQIEFKGRKIDFRIGTIPSVDGEKITIRVLDPDNLLTLEDMFEPYPELLERAQYLTNISPGIGGMVIISGPTGSGKTTTNYGFIRDIDRISNNVMSAEDPVEFEMPLMTQSQVNPEAGITFPRLLRAQLRNDPDVLLIGEMRDSETAEIAVRSADTGHAIFTTLHTDDAISTVNRFISMLPPDFESIGRKSIANNLKAIINQRLARRLCSCSKSVPVKDALGSAAQYLEIKGDTVNVPGGCPKCDHTGYKGRVMVPEALFFESKKISGQDVSDAISSGELNAEFAKSSPNIFYFTLQDACNHLLSTGKIDVEEAKKMLGIN